MEPLTFEILRQAWDQIKTSGKAALGKDVPGLIRPEEIFVKRISEDDHYITVEFKGFESAAENSDQTIPLTKRVIYNWVRRFSSNVQIMRSEIPSLVVRIDRNMRGSEMIPMESAVESVPDKYVQPARPRSLTNIITVVEVDGE